MYPMRQLIIFGDSVIKGVHHCGGKFHLCPDHDFASLQAVGVEAHNYAKMGATIGTGLSILQRRLSACVPGATVLFSFGGNDCDYIGLSNSRVSKVITSVENKGFIRRNINKEDKRQMFFSLTPKGKEKIQQMMQAELNMDSLFNQLKEYIQKG